jgi:hypothetical protein
MKKDSHRVACLRSVDGELRAVTRDGRRLLSAERAALYLRDCHGIDVDGPTLTQAAFDGDITFYFLKPPAARDLTSADVRFRRRDLDDSDWLYVERLLARATPEHRAVMVVALRHAPSKIVSAESLAAVTPAAVAALRAHAANRVLGEDS